ncbi:hypothetical protein IE81DRAFT_325150 [Ceraceosorus guamensis]|uniref:Uncharacterized protein n=1 Tax=Ceraceosorus guamensis TaxID=1522189 RepID=A0A316VTH8_9BASI|nr:hypothetical protein IE81DRAFT_325150 [Ceraceosorus guamensis]PWN40896.1 hypothetical protein IE81DRAFT_325150 [Ceraceosorus guamensis]
MRVERLEEELAQTKAKVERIETSYNEEKIQERERFDALAVELSIARCQIEDLQEDLDSASAEQEIQGKTDKDYQNLKDAMLRMWLSTPESIRDEILATTRHVASSETSRS